MILLSNQYKLKLQNMNIFLLDMTHKRFAKMPAQLLRIYHKNKVYRLNLNIPVSKSLQNMIGM